MTTYNLQRTGLPELTFDGRLLAHEISDDVNGVTQGRVTEISIYEASDGELIVAVDYRSPFESELSDSMAEAVNSASEVDDVLSLYEPNERLDHGLFDERVPNGLQSVETTLIARFDRQVTSVLNQLALLEQTPQQT